GWGSSVDLHAGSTNGLPVTAGAIQPTTDGEDFWTAVLTPGAQSLLYATFFGGTQTDDHVDGGTSRFDKRGVIYQSICGSCPGARSAANFVTDFPTTSSAAFPTNLSPRCSNTSIKLDFQITYAVDARFDVNPKLGCQPLNVQLTDLSFNAQQYKWDFGDGSPVDTNQNPNHTYTQPGKYRIKQVITNPNACNFSDSFFRTVEVIDGGEADFTFTQKECNNTEVTFENTSDGSNLGYKWRFPDGTTSTDENPKFEFTGPGTHIVTLVANPGTLCADSVTQSITLKDYRLSDWSFPNVFTPGNDSLNNCYSFEGLLVECDKVKIKIFNRWGELVYKTENTADCWNGRMLNTGDQLPEGVYYVVAKLERLDGEELEYNGTVTLFR
ncbi:MAG TPA: PKD domain-containing protein, partial [Bacillota bacterium]|nr:PKD domain-containing protein [Bacillota bacterium]